MGELAAVAVFRARMMAHPAVRHVRQPSWCATCHPNYSPVFGWDDAGADTPPLDAVLRVHPPHRPAASRGAGGQLEMPAPREAPALCLAHAEQEFTRLYGNGTEQQSTPDGRGAAGA